MLFKWLTCGGSDGHKGGMTAFLLLTALQVLDFNGLDSAHEAWAKCLVSAAATQRAGDDLSRREAVYRACATEEGALRAALVRMHPDASAADIDDVLVQFKSRTAHLVNARRPAAGVPAGTSSCRGQPAFAISLGSPETLAQRMDGPDRFYQRCHGPGRSQAEVAYFSYDDGSVRRQLPGQPAAQGARELLSLYIQHRGRTATAWLTWFNTNRSGNFCHFETTGADDPALDERVSDCFRALTAATSKQ